MRKRISNENGYSLIELVIVIAIIAILSGMAMVSMAAIKTSRANASMHTFDTELSALITRTKAQSKDNAIIIKRNSRGDGYEVYYGTSTDGTLAKWSQTSTEAEAKMDRVDIYYDAGSGEVLVDGSDTILLKINKADGSVISGAGVYNFCRSGTTRSVGTVTFNRSSGSHYFGN